jgi:hypothetical protein
MARAAEAAGHDRFSRDWYASMRDQYLAQFPNADQRSKDNMNMFVERAKA